MATESTTAYEDTPSELGSTFDDAVARADMSRRSADTSTPRAQPAPLGHEGVTRAAPALRRQVGRGPVPRDSRKFRYDLDAGRSMPAVPFGASRSDRLDAADAGDVLHRLHETFGIDRESEDVLHAFDKALFWEHTINGASLMQTGEGVLRVGESEFEVRIVKQTLGVNQRKFFRAFADDIADNNREVIANFDAFDPESAEKYGQLMQVAVERGLQKYPFLAHDSSDAGVRLSIEERVALMASKRVVLESTVNKVDGVRARVSGAAAPVAIEQ